jgi:hypothetical protein
MSSVQEAAEDVLPLVEEVETAEVTPLWMAADSIILIKIMIVIMQMLKIMQDFPAYKLSEEEQAVNASLVTLTQDHQAARLTSASSILAVEVDHPPNLLSKLARVALFALKKERRLLVATMEELTALIHKLSVRVLERNTVLETVWEEVVVLTTYANVKQATKE